MKQVLWFRRDLRVEDSALLHYARGEVLPIFIFDLNILDKLPKDDKRVTFIYQSVILLKKQLQNLGLDLAIFYGKPKEIFESLKKDFDEVLCSCDFDSYAIKRDKEIESLIPMQRFYDSFLIHPNDGLKADGTPYKVFTPFYNNLMPLWDCSKIEEYTVSKTIKLIEYNFAHQISLEKLGFIKQKLTDFLYKNVNEVIDEFLPKLSDYKTARDLFSSDGTSNLSVYLRFGLVSPKQLFNKIKQHPYSEDFIRELFWREFYNSILYHFPSSEFENFNGKNIPWKENEQHFKMWSEGKTGVPIIDASMISLNQTGLMHNRLRMIVASFLTKNLFLPWKWGEEYFALKLLDYEASSNIGSWQWGASTGADSVPYFRIFNPYTQSAKFDKDGIFIKSILKELSDEDPKLFHKENGVQSNLFLNYPSTLVNIKQSREDAINIFKKISV